MKKTTLIIIIIFFFTSMIIGSFFFIKNARENRSWPFNSTLSNYLPKSIKHYAYKFTNPEKKIYESHYYNIQGKYYSIPSINAVGNGGGLSLFDNNNILTVLDNGEVFLFNTNEHKFSNIKSSELLNKYSSIRDTLYIDGQLIILAVKEKDNVCSNIFLDEYRILKNAENNIILNFIKTKWESEDLCDDPQNNNSGGRVIKLNNKFYVSTGYFTPNIDSGINSFPQNINSSFGKILEIDNSGNVIVYSLGHRNPQGLFLFENKLIISSEHGPKGGDELNFIEKNNNYGWPCKTKGTLYSYENSGIKEEIWPSKNYLKKYGCNELDDYTDPLYTWTPSIAASQGFQYKGDHFNNFKKNIILGSLGGTSLFRIVLTINKKIINVERIKINERIRDIIETMDGKIAVYTDGGSIVLLSKVLRND